MTTPGRTALLGVTATLAFATMAFGQIVTPMHWTEVHAGAAIPPGTVSVDAGGADGSPRLLCRIRSVGTHRELRAGTISNDECRVSVDGGVVHSRDFEIPLIEGGVEVRSGDPGDSEIAGMNAEVGVTIACLVRVRRGDRAIRTARRGGAIRYADRTTQDFGNFWGTSARAGGPCEFAFGDQALSAPATAYVFRRSR